MIRSWHHFIAAMLLFVMPLWSTPGDSQDFESVSCLDVITGSELNDFLVNGCGTGINVVWYDEGSCTSACAAHVAANDRMSIPKVKGRIYFAACYSPQQPVGYDGAYDANYSCS